MSNLTFEEFERKVYIEGNPDQISWVTTLVEEKEDMELQIEEGIGFDLQHKIDDLEDDVRDYRELLTEARTCIRELEEVIEEIKGSTNSSPDTTHLIGQIDDIL